MIRRIWEAIRAGGRTAPEHAQLGRKGERTAARWLRRRGYRIVERNVTRGRDEADIIALAPNGRTLVVVEVKTRKDDRIAPELSVTAQKQRYLSRLAARLLQSESYRDHAVRFDVLCVIWPDRGRPAVRHIEGAFDSMIG